MALGDSNIGARFKQARQADEPQERVRTPEEIVEAYQIRGKMLGVLLRDARLSVRRKLEDCARFLNIAPSELEAWEYGDQVPSLPQLELLAHYLDVPVSHFWGTHTLEGQSPSPLSAQDEFMALRDRMIGVLLRQAREGRGLSVDDLAEASNLPADLIHQYEVGELSIPMHELTVLANGVNKNINYFLESASSVGDSLALQESWKRFAEMPPELREFVSNPLNVGFLHIAKMLSAMPAEQLREVGVSILDITR